MHLLQRFPAARVAGPAEMQPDLQAEQLQQALLASLVPVDEADERSVVLEVRAGTGGEEASLFAGDLLRMYEAYCRAQGWRFEVRTEWLVSPGAFQVQTCHTRCLVQVVELAEGEAGGVKQASAAIAGTRVYGSLKFESGVHRVQRVPTTETAGRIHTSAASVVVLPQADAVRARESCLPCACSLLCLGLHSQQQATWPCCCPSNCLSRLAVAGGGGDSRVRPAHRHIQGQWGRRPAREHHRLGRAHHPPPQWPGRRNAGITMPCLVLLECCLLLTSLPGIDCSSASAADSEPAAGRALAAQEPSKGAQGPAGAHRCSSAVLAAACCPDRRSNTRMQARLYEAQRRATAEEHSRQRKGLAGSGDRSERVRTYNFPQVCASSCMHCSGADMRVC